MQLHHSSKCNESPHTTCLHVYAMSNNTVCKVTLFLTCAVGENLATQQGLLWLCTVNRQVPCITGCTRSYLDKVAIITVMKI